MIQSSKKEQQKKSVLQTATSSLTYQQLRVVAEQHIAFLQHVGQSNNPVSEMDVSEFFTVQCKKVVNGNVLLQSLKNFPDQLNTARNAIGKWTIVPVLSTVSPQDGTCTIQIDWVGEKMDLHTTMIILYVDSNEKIFEIHEVFSEKSLTTLGFFDLLQKRGCRHC